MGDAITVGLDVRVSLGDGRAGALWVAGVHGEGLVGDGFGVGLMLEKGWLENGWEGDRGCGGCEDGTWWEGRGGGGGGVLEGGGGGRGEVSWWRS